MSDHSGFQVFQRTDGTKIACQPERILFVSKGDRGAVLHFAAGTQVNLTMTFEEVVEALSAAVSA